MVQYDRQCPDRAAGVAPDDDEYGQQTPFDLFSRKFCAVDDVISPIFGLNILGVSDLYRSDLQFSQ